MLERQASTELFHKIGDPKIAQTTKFVSLGACTMLRANRNKGERIQIHARPHASTWKSVEEMHSTHIHVGNSCECT